jgi:hypothetical protein
MTVLIKEVEIGLAVSRIEKHRIAVIAALCYVVRHTGENGSMASGHPTKGTHSSGGFGPGFALSLA